MRWILIPAITLVSLVIWDTALNDGAYTEAISRFVL